MERMEEEERRGGERGDRKMWMECIQRVVECVMAVAVVQSRDGHTDRIREEDEEEEEESGCG